MRFKGKLIRKRCRGASKSGIMRWASCHPAEFVSSGLQTNWIWGFWFPGRTMLFSSITNCFLLARLRFNRIIPAQGTIRTLSEMSVAGFVAVSVNWFCPSRSAFFNSAGPQATTQDVWLRSIRNPVKAV